MDGLADRPQVSIAPGSEARWIADRVPGVWALAGGLDSVLAQLSSVGQPLPGTPGFGILEQVGSLLGRRMVDEVRDVAFRDLFAGLDDDSDIASALDFGGPIARALEINGIGTLRDVGRWTVADIEDMPFLGIAGARRLVAALLMHCLAAPTIVRA
ncbi:MAG: hypothetical protein ACRDUY_05060 [Nitriliruptorales bacterium]